jgi:uncharacterized protein YeaC (DUF1315 family)
MEYLVPIQLNTEFPAEIEKLVRENEIEYMDAVILWCERNNLEVEFAAEMIRRNTVLKAKIQIEAENLNFMKKSARLPI